MHSNIDNYADTPARPISELSCPKILDAIRDTRAVTSVQESAVAPSRPLKVAVASNFMPVGKVLSAHYSACTRQEIELIGASTGKLVTLTRHGAPYDLLLAADRAGPRLLVEAGFGVPDTLKDYAVGALVLWSRHPELVDRHGSFLSRCATAHHQPACPTGLRLVLANPRLAPYGAAARQVLLATDAAQHWYATAIRAENVNQVLQYLRSGTADLGFISRQQWLALNGEGSAWEIPESLHEPIRQAMLLLRDSAPARRLWRYMHSPPAAQYISTQGYRAPEAASSE